MHLKGGSSRDWINGGFCGLDFRVWNGERVGGQDTTFFFMIRISNAIPAL